MIVTPSFVISLVLAILIGLMIGFERSYRAGLEQSPKSAGMRTFIVVCIVGFLFADFFESEPFVLIATVVTFSSLILSLNMIRTLDNEPGLTTSITLLVVFLSGIFIGLGYPLIAVFVGLVTLSLVSSKRLLHRFADLLSDQELESAMRFLAVALIVLPITYTFGPIHPLIGPGRIFDPTKAVLMVLFVSSISFTSYIVINLFGTSKGMELSAFIGGLVSSAAATASMSEKCKKNPGLLDVSTVCILLTNASMFIRDYIIIFVMGGIILAVQLAVPVAVLLVLTILISVYIIKKKITKVDTVNLDLENPFALKPALKFALIFSIVWASTYILQNQFGSVGVYIVSVGGLISTTSVSASLAAMYASGEISSSTAISTILLAFGLSSFSKIFIARGYVKGLAKSLAWPMILTGTISFIMMVLIN